MVTTLNLPVIRRVVELASEYQLFLHLHGDSDAVEYVFEQDPNAKILWAAIPVLTNHTRSPTC